MAFGVIFLGAAIVIPQITMPFNGMLQGFMGDMDIDITEKKDAGYLKSRERFVYGYRTGRSSTSEK